MWTMSVDPGLDFGWALWHDGKLDEWGVRTKKFSDWEDHLDFCMRQYTDLLDNLVLAGCDNEVVCEKPSFFGGSGGMVTAQSGALVKLTIVVGAFAGIAHTYGVPFHFMEVNAWKGQMSKPMTEQRIRKALGPRVNSVKSHAWDAIGIGYVHSGGKL